MSWRAMPGCAAACSRRASGAATRAWRRARVAVGWLAAMLIVVAAFMALVDGRYACRRLYAEGCCDDDESLGAESGAWPWRLTAL